MGWFILRVLVIIAGFIAGVYLGLLIVHMSGLA